MFPILIVLYKPGQMSTAFVHRHLGTLELVQLFANGCLVFGRQPGPRFVRPSIVVVRLCHLDVIIEPDDLLFLQFVNGRPEAEFPQKIPFFLLLLLLLFSRRLT